jgi:hypothetical protein
MSTKIKNFMAGRATIVTVAVASVMALGAFTLLSTKANAQVNISRHIITFSPILQAAPLADHSGTNSILIGLLLPAIQKGSTPFVVEASTGDGSVLVLSSPPDDNRTTSFFDVFFESDQAGRGFVMHLVNRKTGEDKSTPTSDLGVTVRLLPAVQRNGFALSPISAGLTVSGIQNVALGDGSVLPIPFKYGLMMPPVDADRQG